MIPGEFDILIVDDNVHEAELILRALKNHSPILNVFHVDNDDMAIEYLLAEGPFRNRRTEERPKAVFLDLNLPPAGGISVLKRVKSDERTRMIPVIILTTSQDAHDIEECYRLGANSYIVKPLDYRHFQETVSVMGTYWISINSTECFV